MLIIATIREPDRATYIADCWVCGQPTMRVDEVITESGSKVSEQCHAEHCDHRDDYYINYEE